MRFRPGLDGLSERDVALYKVPAPFRAFLEPAGGGEPAAKRARKSPAPKKCEKKFLDQLNATEIMVLKVWDGTEWRFIHIIEDFHKATASVLLLVPDGERKVLSLECVWKAFLLYVFQKGTE